MQRENQSNKAEMMINNMDKVRILRNVFVMKYFLFKLNSKIINSNVLVD